MEKGCWKSPVLSGCFLFFSRGVRVRAWVLFVAAADN